MGIDVSYKHLRVFGCRAFVHIPKYERFKLAKKTKHFIFRGYLEDEFGYRFWDPISKKVIRSRGVVFFEDQTTEDIDKSSHSESPSIIGLNPVFPNLSTRAHGENTQEVEDHEYDNNDEDGDEPSEQTPILVEP